jgi:hypothetical protein
MKLQSLSFSFRHLLLGVSDPKHTFKRVLGKVIIRPTSKVINLLFSGVNISKKERVLFLFFTDKLLNYRNSRVDRYETVSSETVSFDMGRQIFSDLFLKSDEDISILTLGYTPLTERERNLQLAWRLYSTNI